jgi:hypothetical protein
VSIHLGFNVIGYEIRLSCALRLIVSLTLSAFVYVVAYMRVVPTVGEYTYQDTQVNALATTSASLLKAAQTLTANQGRSLGPSQWMFPSTQRLPDPTDRAVALNNPSQTLSISRDRRYSSSLVLKLETARQIPTVTPRACAL